MRPLIYCAALIAPWCITSPAQAFQPGATVWGPGVVITDNSTGKKYGVVYGGHVPFDTKKECDEFRATDEGYKQANERLEAKAKAAGLDASFEYKCFEGQVAAEGEDNL
jgi:hypothetical protein